MSSTDQDPQLQLDALAAEDCLKIYTDTATGTKADRPEWNKCLADLGPGDTLIIWKIDRSAATCAISSRSSPPWKPTEST